MTVTACHFCKSRHLKCDGGNPCVQCALRKQECIFSNAQKKRGRASKTTDNPSKKIKTSEDSFSSTSSNHDRMLDENKEKQDNSILALSSHHTALLRQIEQGDTENLTVEELIDLVLAQQSQLEGHATRLQHLTISSDVVLGDINDYRRDRSADKACITDLAILDDYPDDSSFATALCQAFSTRHGMWYSSGNVPVDHVMLYKYLKIFNSMDQFSVLRKAPIPELTEALCYGTVITSGCAILLRWQLGAHYAGRTDVISRTLNRTNVTGHPQCVAKILSCLGYLAAFNLGVGDIATARNNILMHYNYYNTFRGLAPLGIVHTIYSYMAGMTTAPEDKLHWIRCSEGLPPGSSSPLVDAIRALSTVGELYAHEEPLLPITTFTQKPTEDEIIIRQKMYDLILTATTKVETFPLYVFSRHNAVYTVLRQILYGLRAVVALQLGRVEEASTYSFSAIQAIKSVDFTILSLFQVFSNSLAIQVAIALGQKDLAKLGMEGVRIQASPFPIANSIMSRLNDQYLAMESESTRIYASHPSATGIHPNTVLPTTSSNAPTSISGLPNPLSNPAWTIGMNMQNPYVGIISTAPSSSATSDRHPNGAASSLESWMAQSYHSQQNRQSSSRIQTSSSSTSIGGGGGNANSQPAAANPFFQAPGLMQQQHSLSSANQGSFRPVITDNINVWPFQSSRRASDMGSVHDSRMNSSGNAQMHPDLKSKSK